MPVAKDPGDIVALDGNALGATYLVISKDPLTAGGVTTLETTQTFDMPMELVAGISLSQRTLGQEFSLEAVSTETPPAGFPDLVITSIQQATTTLTVTTEGPHNLVPGKRIDTYGIPDSRLNYPALVVATVPAPNQFTVTAGPMGALPSVNAGPFTTGFVERRSAMGGAADGTSLIFENATPTNAAVYVRCNAGDAFPSGVGAGNHAATTLTSASIQAIVAATTNAFLPSTLFGFTMRADRLQWTSKPVDSATAATAIVTREQIVPNPDKAYKARIRTTNNRSWSAFTAQIVRPIKTGTTTATLEFGLVGDVSHGAAPRPGRTAFGDR
jgi:hypothetical protein